ncbi:uncharacterized protein LOC127833918 [Dreissena polymorpha]|uniref:uncharacterized protein LOC127833918 n=1 Tax=Dreissena polymorpha TaxID=45954 RepID=UPI0022650AB1|nr:uncharacterized protein LOC127833918 [Dreissena polymorpha]
MTVSFPKEITTVLEMENNFIKLNCDWHKTVNASPISLPSIQRPLSVELLVSVDLHKTGDDEREPWITGLDFLSDGRLVAVDNVNRKCIILNQQLHKLGKPYKFKHHPHGVVCVSYNKLCVTFGKVVRLQSVSSDNTIRLTREISTSSRFYSMSSSQMVVSSYDDPRAVRMLSVDGVESDFDKVVFPIKTSKIDESKSTYVQSKTLWC